MRILVTADLHYDIARSREPATELARSVCGIGGDAIVLVGDSAGANLEILVDCLELFDDFKGRKFFVPGNHCLWSQDGESSLERYERIIPETASQVGWTMLDHNPAMLGDIGLVGSVGWYDYSFADEALGIPLDFYRAKVAPGAAKYLGGYEDLLERHRDRLTSEHMGLGARWMDGRHVDLGMTDEQFTTLLCDRLAKQLEELAPRVKRVVAFVHHLAFPAAVPPDRPARFAFAAAYMGSYRLGETLRKCPKLTHVYCGHSHWFDRRRVGEIEVVNVGSTYIKKRLEVLDLPDARCGEDS